MVLFLCIDKCHKKTEHVRGKRRIRWTLGLVNIECGMEKKNQKKEKAKEGYWLLCICARTTRVQRIRCWLAYLAYPHEADTTDQQRLASNCRNAACKMPSIESGSNRLIESIYPKTKTRLPVDSMHGPAPPSLSFPTQASVRFGPTR